ncbi:general transcription factor IIF subunit 2 [Raphidocelis subcapitata]|uniref:General transcription factor IIF subunit 2 n=1 Tax=Raphidocelis subcapitata TaxID=307507 RepID=A0A2V0P534_9CHLO|nr:general transcription factor IIF subunit 2 [Raphidocelis subcapitata]|eukprot:GBF92297.1 general transcription factor IIF subunit 2 [Raphidocelis subcapitata]
MTSIDTEKAERRVWLVRVPPYIAERWKAACAQNTGGVDEDAAEDGAGSSLGRISITSLQDGSTRTMLELPEGMCDAALPRRYTLQPGTDVLDMSVLSSEGDEGGGDGEVPRLVRPRLDGVVSQKHDAVPAQSAPGAAAAAAAAGGAPPIDAAYRALTRKRTLASLQKGRSVAVITDGRAAQRLYQQQHNRASLYVKYTQADKEEFEARSARDLASKAGAGKRSRMERPELEQLLFRLFERQAQWALPALQKETDQPIGWLREVLGEVAVTVKRGPVRDMWELQRQFKVAGGGGGGAGAGAGGADG